VCVYSLWYPACNMHAPCCHLWPAQLYNIFHTSQMARFSKNQIIEHKSVFWYHLEFRKKFSLLEELNEIWSEMFIGLHVITHYSCSNLMKLGFHPPIFEKYSYVKFHEIPSIWSRVVACERKDKQTDGLTDIHDKTNTRSRFPQFREGSWKW
jgi:hypothetical protein